MSLPTASENGIPNEQDEPLAEEAAPRYIMRLPRPRRAAVTTILGLTILVYLLQMLTGQGLLALGDWTCPYFFSPDLPACYGLKVNELIVQGQYWRLLAPILLHASILHIGFNMYALYVLGPELERHFGTWQFVLLYLVGGLSGFVISFLLTPAPSLGASTAVFGLLAAQGVFIFRNQRVFGPRARLALRSILNIALINFIIGLSPGIDNWGHFGGALGGALFAWFAAPDYDVRAEGLELTLENRRPAERAIWAGLAVALVFIGLALTGF